MQSFRYLSGRLRAGALVALLTTLMCGGEPEAPRSVTDSPPPPGSPSARWELLELLREDSARVPHPADGGGRAWLVGEEGDTEVATAGAPGRFTIAYEVGPEGIAQGGAIFFQVSPFWGWSTPQVEIPDAPGYTEIEVSADDMELFASTLDQQLLVLEVMGRALAPGDLNGSRSESTSRST